MNPLKITIHSDWLPMAGPATAARDGDYYRLQQGKRITLIPRAFFSQLQAAGAVQILDGGEV